MHILCMVRTRRQQERIPPAHFIGAWRRHRQLTQEQLAERAGVARSTITRIEHGEYSLSTQTAAAIAVALYLDVPDLFRDPDDIHGVWSIATQLAKLDPAQKRVVEMLINTLLKEANGQA